MSNSFQSIDRFAAGLTRSVIRRVLKNPFYAGRVVWGGEEYEGVHQPLVSLDTWQRVQDHISGRRVGGRRRKGERRREYLFAGLIRCATCGCTTLSTTIAS